MRLPVISVLKTSQKHRLKIGQWEQRANISIQGHHEKNAMRLAAFSKVELTAGFRYPI
jgi:hypothetical protein